MVDCASSDGSLDVARSHPPQGIPFQAIDLGENRGFAGGMNAAIGASTASRSAWILSLNADARPAPDYLTRLLARAGSGPEVGAVTAALVAPPPRTDGGGWTPAACGRPAPGGIWTGARARRTGASSEPPSGSSAPPARPRSSGGRRWTTRRWTARSSIRASTPSARTPSSASACASVAGRSSTSRRRWPAPAVQPAGAALRHAGVGQLPFLKNRYLLRLYHQTAGNFVRTFFPTLLRDLMAIGWTVLAERSSLPAWSWLWKHRGELLRRRRAIQARRTVSGSAIDRWFSSPGEPL